jgi:ankyrin repeat protein
LAASEVGLFSGVRVPGDDLESQIGVLMPSNKQTISSRTGLGAARITRPAGMTAKTWAVFEACARGDLTKVTTLLAKEPRLVNAQFWYRFPIHMAVFAGSADVVKLLLDRGADPGQSNYTYDSWDKLLQAAQMRGDRAIETLLQRSMQKRFNYNPDFDSLKEAIIARDTDRVEAVLRRQPKLALASDALGNNALHWSVIMRQLNLIERFVRLGTPIDALRADGQTPVLLAANGATDYWYRLTRAPWHPTLRNTSVIVGYLLALGAEYNISVAAATGDQERVEQILREDPTSAHRLDSARLSPLSYAAAAGHQHIVRVLLEHGADPNVPENCAPRGLALFNACERNDLPMAQLLLDHTADPNAGRDSCGCCLTICQVCHGRRAKPLQQLLRKYGAYTPPYAMSTAEMKQAIRDRHQVVHDEEFFGNLLAKCDKELMDLYLDLQSTAKGEIKCLGGSVYPSSPKILRHLLDRGLDPNRTDWLGTTFLHACAENGDRSSAAILLNAGADINARDFEFQGTPLAAAIRHEPWRDFDRDNHAERQRQMVEFLLKHEAATNLPDDESWATPLAWARRRGLKEIEAMLLEKSRR